MPGRFFIQADAETPEAAALRDFIEYGTPIDGVTATSVAFDLPGGFGGEFHDVEDATWASAVAGCGAV